MGRCSLILWNHSTFCPFPAQNSIWDDAFSYRTPQNYAIYQALIHRIIFYATNPISIPSPLCIIDSSSLLLARTQTPFFSTVTNMFIPSKVNLEPLKVYIIDRASIGTRIYSFNIHYACQRTRERNRERKAKAKAQRPAILRIKGI